MIKTIQFEIAHFEQTVAFYTQVLGMPVVNHREDDKAASAVLAFDAQDFFIELQHNKMRQYEAYTHQPNDYYWKYSLFVQDIQRVYRQIKAAGVTISEPIQFGDVGYLAHTQDTENHHIEFIQTTFQANTIFTQPNPEHPLLESPKLGLLTIRTQDPLKGIRFYEGLFDMTLFVRMYVDRGRGFTLYFLGDKRLTPPSPDIDDIANREWMYQQNHLFIELQYYWGSETDQSFNLTPNKYGFQKMVFETNLDLLQAKLTQTAIPFTMMRNEQTHAPEIHLVSADKHKIVATAQHLR